MRFKRITAALLTGILMSFSMVGTAFAYTGETEPAEGTAASETETIEVIEEKAEKPSKDTSESEVPYDVTVSKDGTYTFTLGDYE